MLILLLHYIKWDYLNYWNLAILCNQNQTASFHISPPKPFNNNSFLGYRQLHFWFRIALLFICAFYNGMCASARFIGVHVSLTSGCKRAVSSVTSPAQVTHHQSSLRKTKMEVTIPWNNPVFSYANEEMFQISIAPHSIWHSLWILMYR